MSHNYIAVYIILSYLLSYCIIMNNDTILSLKVGRTWIINEKSNPPAMLGRME